MTARTLRTPQALADAGLIPPERVAALEAVAARYAVAGTPAFADLIDPNDPADPIGLQMLPQPAELETLAAVERRVLWLAVRMIDYANRERPKTDELKVGGHQASSASMVSPASSKRKWA